MISKKVILTGSFGVGKTSLFNKFLYNRFSEKYLTTIGVKVDKKKITIDDKEISLMLWDIAGESSAVKIPKKYFAGAHGILYVFDLTREETYLNIESDLFEINKTLKDCPLIVLANKSDLVEDSFIEDLRSKLSTNFKITSAKTGDHVEDSFLQLAKDML